MWYQSWLSMHQPSGVFASEVTRSWMQMDHQVQCIYQALIVIASAHSCQPAAVNQLAVACDVGNNQLFVLCRCLQLPLMSGLPRCCCCCRGLFPRVHVQSQINVTLLIKMDSVLVYRHLYTSCVVDAATLEWKPEEELTRLNVMTTGCSDCSTMYSLA